MTNILNLPHRLNRQEMTCRAVVETPKTSRSKFDYDEDSGLFELAGLLPEGMSFPLDFGFFPSTKAEDGDPLDVLVLHDEPVPVGALLNVRLIGIIQAEQTEHDSTVRNDRLLAVTTCSHQYEDVREIDALGQTFLDHLTQFWVNYNALKGKGFKVLGVLGPEAAADALGESLHGTSVMSADPFDLQRFVAAQAGVYTQALEELRAGRKRSHWMWFIFPQLKGLGASSTAQFYGIGSLEEAAAYLEHPVLGPRLEAAVATLQSAPSGSLNAILGSPDDLKFRSSMTLFAVAAPDGPYQAALDRWCVGDADPKTLALLRRAPLKGAG